MLGTLDLEAAAKKAAGNWKRFGSFAWFRKRELVDADQWAVVYTSNRDSTLLDQSNASVIEMALEPFTEGDDPDVVMESHSHWAVGHVDGFSIRVYDANWYRGVVVGEEMEGWLCPALGLYFTTAPKKIFVRAESLPPGVNPIWEPPPGDVPRRFVSAKECDK